MEGLLRKIIWIVIGLLFFFNFAKDGFPEEEKLKVPSPMEIRSYRPLPNRTLVVEYANGRSFLYRISNLKPVPECNQVKVNSEGDIIIITQAPSQSYEYILEPMPFMVMEWKDYER